MSEERKRSRYEVFDYLLCNRLPSKKSQESDDDELPESEYVGSENEVVSEDEDLSKEEDLSPVNITASMSFDDRVDEYFRNRDPMPQSRPESLYSGEGEETEEEEEVPRIICKRSSCTQLIEFLVTHKESKERQLSWITYSSIRGSGLMLGSAKPKDIQVTPKTPLSLSEEIYQKTKKEVVLICFCDPEMPGGFWFQAGPHTDDDEVDLLASTDVYKQLQSHVLETMLPLKADSCLLVKNVSVFRPGEGAKLRKENWSKVHVFFFPYLSKLKDKPLTEQFKFILKCLSHQQLQQSDVVFPLNRWARNNFAAAEVGTRLTQALETSNLSGSLYITCPPNMKLWHQSLVSVMGSFQVRQAEQKPKEETKPIVKPKEEFKPTPVHKTKKNKKKFSSKESSKERFKKP